MSLIASCSVQCADLLAAKGLAPFQGPALLAFNDAVFSEADFASISSIGSGVKREQKGKTGRFGVGFNACFHLTDLPSFVSGLRPFLGIPGALQLQSPSMLVAP